MSQKKPSLGRGLEALLGQMSANRPGAAPAAPGSVSSTSGSGLAASSSSPTAPAAPAEPLAPAALLRGDTLARLPLDLLQRGRYQPRIDMRPETLEDLANSIRAQGVIQPVVVRPIGHPAAPPAPSATRSSPASAAGAPRRSPASPRSPPSSAACRTKRRSRWR